MSNKKLNTKTNLKPTKPNLFEILQKVKDNRDPSGRRHHIAVVLLVNIMAIMSGYTGIRSKQDFVNRNREKLTKIFHPDLIKHGIPSKNTIDRVMQTTDHDELNQALLEFSQLSKGTAIHIDGKAIRSTAQLGQSSKQTFTSIVTAFADGKGIKAKSFVNGTKNHEISTVQDLIQALNLTGMVLTLDALHCQKKQ